MVNKKRKIILIIIAVALCVLFFFAFDCRLTVREYEIESSKISSPVRLALITDLHSCGYGKDQQTLVDAIVNESPDMVLLGGDIFDDVMDDGNTEAFIESISGMYPCYYVTGNHEYWSGEEAFEIKMDILERYGVTILSGQYETVTVRGETLNICGVDDPDAYMVTKGTSRESSEVFFGQFEAVSSASESGVFTLLLSHRPELFEEYTKYDTDLILCGHAHGGQWRIPFVLNGLYAPDQGLFPKYAGGRYEKDGSVMIVSRGLARETTPVPRIFNRPEIVIVNIT